MVQQLRAFDRFWQDFQNQKANDTLSLQNNTRPQNRTIRQNMLASVNDCEVRMEIEHYNTDKLEILRFVFNFELLKKLF